MLISCNQFASTVTALDGDLREIARIDVPAQPHMIVFDPVRELLYAAITYRDGFYDKHGDHGHEIVVIDPATWTIADVVDIGPYAGPHDLAVVGDSLYVACESHGGCLLVIDLVSRKPVGHVPTGAGGPHWLTVLPGGKKAYTGNKEAEFVSVLDLVDLKPAGRIPMPTGSEDLEATPDGRLVYATDRSSPLLHVIDTETDSKIGLVELPDHPNRIHITSTGSVIVSHFHDPGSVSVVDPASLTVVERVTVGSVPLGITSNPDASRIYVNNANSGSMTVIDTDGYRVDATIPMDSGAHEIIYLDR